MTPLGHITLQNTYDMYKVNNTNNNTTRKNNADNGVEGNNHLCILKIIIKTPNKPNFD